jgi:flagellar motor switch protein FliG
MKNNMHSKIIDKIGENDDQMAEKIRRKMFTFDSLINLDGRSLQMILREVNNESLALALKNASVEIKERIFANMSPRAADMIRDDLEAMGPVRVSEVEAMQQSIVKIAMQLEQEGKFLSDDNDNVLA